jgi:nuclear pore complex protein Nup155
MSFPQTTPMRAPPGAFLNTPAIASRFQSTSDPTRRQLFQQPETRDARSGALVRMNSSSAQGHDGTVATSSTAQGSDSLVAQNSMPAPKPENIPPVVKAANAINTFLKTDESFPDLDSCCRRKSDALLVSRCC